jgi:sulfhydrogenase subunit gamma (sulfur reductase)
LDENLVPRIVRVDEIREETPDTRSLRLVFEDEEVRESFEFMPGQFCLISVFGMGEATFCISSPPSWKDFIEVSVKRVGKVTAAIHDLEVGDKLGFRGPYGNSFDLKRMEGRSVVFVGGGIGLAPLRPPIYEVLGRRDKYEDVSIIYGARSVLDIAFRKDLEEWGRRRDVRLVTTVDPGGEDETWKGEVGLVPHVLEKVNPPSDSVLVTCGPPIMIKYVILSAREMGFRPADVITTLEMKMKCGAGLCGRCNIGSMYVCRDGPVFSLEEVESLPDEF